MFQDFFILYFLDVIDHGDQFLFHHSFQNCTPFLIAPSQHLMNRPYFCFFISNLNLYIPHHIYLKKLEIHYEMLNNGSFFLPPISIWHERFHITSSHVPRTCATPSFDNSTHMIIPLLNLLFVVNINNPHYIPLLTSLMCQLKAHSHIHKLINGLEAST